MDLSSLTEVLTTPSQLSNDISKLEEDLYKGSEETVRLRLNKIIAEVNKLTNSDYKKIEETEDIIKTIFENKISFSIIGENYPIFIVYAVNTAKDYIFKLISPEELNCKGRFERTALHYAVQKQLADVVRLLLEAGADINCKTEINLTPLDLAASLQNEEICAILLNFGAEVEPNSPCRNSPLYKVCGKCFLKEHLVKPNKNFDAYYYNEYDCYEQSSPVFNKKIAKLLIDKGANLEGPFFEVCSGGSLEPVKFLLQFGVSLNARDEEGNSALHYAAKGNSLKVVEFLLKEGFDINIRNTKNQTPLVYMMNKCDSITSCLGMIEYLVDRGADINARDNLDATALHRTTEGMSSKNGVECLLELGADFKLKCKKRTDCCNFYRPNVNLDQKTLISYIALHESELGNYINCYFNEMKKKLPNALKYFQKCRLEVEKLKSKTIVKRTRFSFYDFLTGGFYNAVQLVKNQQIKKVFVSRKYYNDFPYYQFLLEKRFERVITLKDAVDKMENFLSNCLSHLPILVNRKILNELSSSDFRKFEHGLLSCQNLVEQEADSILEFEKDYYGKIVGTRDIGAMVNIYPAMTPVLVPYSQMEIRFSPHSIEVIGELIVRYWGRHPVSGQMILTGL